MLSSHIMFNLKAVSASKTEKHDKKQICKTAYYTNIHCTLKVQYKMCIM